MGCEGSAVQICPSRPFAESIGAPSKSSSKKGERTRRSPIRVLEHRPTCQDGVLPVSPAGGAALAQDDSRVSPVLAFAHVEAQDGIPVEPAVVGRVVVPAAPPLFVLPAVAAVAEQAGTQSVAAACSAVEFQAESQAVPVAPAAFPVDSSASDELQALA